MMDVGVTRKGMNMTSKRRSFAEEYLTLRFPKELIEAGDRYVSGMERLGARIMGLNLVDSVPLLDPSRNGAAEARMKADVKENMGDCPRYVRCKLRKEGLG